MGCFSKIGNNSMRALGRKKHMFFGNARPKSNARNHLKQRKKHSGLRGRIYIFVSGAVIYGNRVLICHLLDRFIQVIIR